MNITHLSVLIGVERAAARKQQDAVAAAASILSEKNLHRVADATKAYIAAKKATTDFLEEIVNDNS